MTQNWYFRTKLLPNCISDRPLHKPCSWFLQRPNYWIALDVMYDYAILLKDWRVKHWFVGFILSTWSHNTFTTHAWGCEPLQVGVCFLELCGGHLHNFSNISFLFRKVIFWRKDDNKKKSLYFSPWNYWDSRIIKSIHYSFLLWCFNRLTLSFVIAWS